ncbi:hypothetical protein CDL12_06937 [Handroanthus impetiginosus]|uniref:Uncharacterized protein n=1 Tax=Handroanthus impetiginosus TaxID=429701 RepID=A0A2G9HS45_9LAMI|nr:hypothetical protein CDL12_06937 [Handroanthus impetiginosus]
MDIGSKRANGPTSFWPCEQGLLQKSMTEGPTKSRTRSIKEIILENKFHYNTLQYFMCILSESITQLLVTVQSGHIYVYRLSHQSQLRTRVPVNSKPQSKRVLEPKTTALYDKRGRKAESRCRFCFLISFCQLEKLLISCFLGLDVELLSLILLWVIHS